LTVFSWFDCSLLRCHLCRRALPRVTPSKVLVVDTDLFNELFSFWILRETLSVRNYSAFSFCHWLPSAGLSYFSSGYCLEFILECQQLILLSYIVQYLLQQLIRKMWSCSGVSEALMQGLLYHSLPKYILIIPFLLRVGIKFIFYHVDGGIQSSISLVDNFIRRYNHIYFALYERRDPVLQYFGFLPILIYYVKALHLLI